MNEVMNPVNYSYDAVEWGKLQNEKGEEVRMPIFPITRYGNILGRPSLVTSVVDTIPTDFTLLKVNEEEMDDALIFDLAKQTW